MSATQTGSTTMTDPTNWDSRFKVHARTKGLFEIVFTADDDTSPVSKGGFSSREKAEAMAETLDTIDICESYLEGYEAHKASGRADNFVHNAASADFAKAQIAFELGY